MFGNNNYKPQPPTNEWRELWEDIWIPVALIGAPLLLLACVGSLGFMVLRAASRLFGLLFG
jgi:hypothetical protein